MLCMMGWLEGVLVQNPYGSGQGHVSFLVSFYWCFVVCVGELSTFILWQVH